MALWWSEERISRTVTQKYIEQELGAKRHKDTLHHVLAFGDGLTDDTYLDWILERSPRFFLILNDIGVPEKIFEIIDRSFDDDDLPLSQDGLWELNLFGTPSETLDKKFYRQQFYFLIHEIEAGGHVDYGNWDIVPVETSLRKGSIPAIETSTERVFARSHLYTRKRIPASGENGIDRVKFIMHLKNMSALQHKHLITVWATYSQHDFNYVLLTPACDLTLKHVLEDKDIAKQFKCLDKHDRRRTLLTWMHCLTSALAYLHSRGFMHKSIRPSSIHINQHHNIYLDDYNALRVLDVDESPNPYSGETYEYSPPENWMRKPTLHETAPLRTVLPGGGRTSRRLPKSNAHNLDSRRPSVISQDGDTRPHSRSQNSSSGSSTAGARPRNALITTFAPLEMAPISLPNKFFPADVFSLTCVNITILSFLLGHGPKSFASHRCKLNRQAGRGNAPPDASFHKNLVQVGKWLTMLEKEAGQKEKKDQSFWGGVVELIKLCREGIAKDQDTRIKASDLEKKTSGWVNFSISQANRCECHRDIQFSEEAEINNAVTRAQRDSVLSWSKISERISSGLYTDDTASEHVTLPRRSLSKRLTLDRAPELRRPRWSRQSQFTRSSNSDEPPLSPKAIDPSMQRQQSDRIRQAVQTAVQSTAIRPQIPKPDNFIVHQGRSTYRLKPTSKKTTPSPSSYSTPLTSPRRSTHPIPPSIQEEQSDSIFGFDPSGNLGEQDVAGATFTHEEEDDEDNTDMQPSAYTLSHPLPLHKPRRQTHPIPSTATSSSRSTGPPSTAISSSSSSSRHQTSAIQQHTVYSNPIDTRVIHGIPPSPSRDSIITTSTANIWGLGNALEEEVDGILGGWEVRGWEGTGITPSAAAAATTGAGSPSEETAQSAYTLGKAKHEKGGNRRRTDAGEIRKLKSRDGKSSEKNLRARKEAEAGMRGEEIALVDWPLPPASPGVALTMR